MTQSPLRNRIFLLGLCVVFYMTLTLTLGAGRSRDQTSSWNGYSNDEAKTERDYYRQQSYNRKSQKSEKPNIILVITDDQDEMLGSMSTMTKTMKIMGNEGVRFNNSFVPTPMCCPSRSSLLTGMLPHNHHVYTNNDNCSGTEWQKVHEPRSFAKYLSDSGYRTGFFGKYLNEYNGTYIPPGWREWVGLVRNSRFYNYTLNFNGKKVKHDDNYYADYFTDLIANDSVTFLRQSKQYFPTKPVMMMLSVPAPHGPEDSAPQYQHMFENNTLHRTPSWNYMNNSDKQWLVQEMKPLQPEGVAFTDLLQQKRLQTLQSVDSLMEKVYYTLRVLGELDNTYIIYTSDHGYHLGQFGIVKGKALPYDFDIRVPLFVRGPGILKDTKIPNPVTNVDLAPTILDMAGIEVPEHMDGRSLLKLIRSHKLSNNLEGKFVDTRREWRHTVLIERGKVTKRMQKNMEREQDNKIIEEYEDEILPYAHPKLRRTLKICKDPSNDPPCKMNQKWVCFRDDRGRKRIKKCRNYNKTVAMDNSFDNDLDSFQRDMPYVQKYANRNCDCRKQDTQVKMSESDLEEEMTRSFMRGRRNKGDKSQYRRAKRATLRASYNEEFELRKSLIAQQLDMNRQRCRFFPNNTLACDKDITKDPAKWNDHKLKLDAMIEETKSRLRNLKLIRKEMKKQRRHLNMNFESNESEADADKYGVAPDNKDCDCDGNMDTFQIPPELSFSDEMNEALKEEEENASEEDEYYNVVQRYGKKKGRRKEKDCDHDNLKCTVQRNDHWHTPPYWTYGPFCYCTNAETNTYWCLRTVNTTHDFLYCEFIDTFLNFYDFKTDPHQLTNQIHSLDYGVINQLHNELTELRKCVGVKQCTKVKNSPEVSEKKRRRRRRIVRKQRRRRPKRV